MAFLPETGTYLSDNDFQTTLFPTNTYKMDLEKQRIQGKVDDLEAMKQVIYCALRTERSTYPIYSNNYGSELETLFGQPITYAIPEIQRMIKETLEWDSRIDLVDSFEFKQGLEKVQVKFIVHTSLGEIPSEMEVMV